MQPKQRKKQQILLSMEMKFVLTSQQHQNHMILHLVDIWVEEAQEDIIHTIGEEEADQEIVIIK